MLGEPSVLLSVVVVNWNGGELLARCIASIDQALPPAPRAQVEVIVVDNGSSDGSTDRLSLRPTDTLLRSDRNLGFGVACNRGAAIARGEFLLLLNPDCELRQGSIERCIAELQRPDMPVGICGIALEGERGVIARSCHRFPHFAELAGTAIGLHALRPGVFDSRMSDWDHRSDRTVDHVIGAFWLLRLSTFRSLGGFDESFFVYLEDLDFSLRARRAGWLTRFVAAPASYHLGGGVSRQIMARRLFYATRSRMLFAYKHLPRWQAHLHAAITLVIEPLSRSLQALLRHSGADLKSTWRAFAMLYRDLPRLALAA
jgi:hypothetical protein